MQRFPFNIYFAFEWKPQTARHIIGWPQGRPTTTQELQATSEFKWWVVNLLVRVEV